MLTKDQARALVVADIKRPGKLRYPGDPSDLVIDDAQTIEKDWGWVFFCNSERCLKTGDMSYAIAGNAPYIVNRYTGRICVAGAGHPIEYYIAEAAQKLPPGARAQRRWAFIVSVVAVAAYVAYVMLQPKPPQLSNQQFVSVTLELHDWPLNPGEVKAELHDPAAIARLAQLLEHATATWEHRCADFGHLRLRRQDGSELSIAILPGHKRTYYEYRCNGIFHVDRARFFETMAPFGVPAERFVDPDVP